MTTGSESVYISAGANLGDRKRNLEQGLASLQEAGILIRKRSSYFETEPVGFREQPWFLNMAIEAATVLPALKLLDRCQGIELALGRARTFPGAPRLLDLDILFYGNCVIETERLVIPHPRAAERKFVLEPLAQIAPAYVHPVLRQTIGSLLASCRDTSIVRPFLSGDDSK
jgi:2-amino-4-hydroxy-6-hydroxymethyldihydropteridine diphosphokinase